MITRYSRYSGRTWGGGTATINDGDLTSAKTDGLQTALDSTAKLASANTFTANQIISGNLSAINATLTGATTRTNLSASNGSVYTFSAETGEFVGLNTEMFWSEEAEIERLVVTNRISVMNLTPTLPEELISNSYVDSQVGSSVKLNSVNTFTANQVIHGDLKANNVVVQNTTSNLNTQLTSN